MSDRAELFNEAARAVRAAGLVALYPHGAALQTMQKLARLPEGEFEQQVSWARPQDVPAWRALRLLGLALELNAWDPSQASNGEAWAWMLARVVRMDGFEVIPGRRYRWWVRKPSGHLLHRVGGNTRISSARSWETQQAAVRAVTREFPLDWPAPAEPAAEQLALNREAP